MKSTSHNTAMQTNWLLVFMGVMAGVMAAVLIGKMPVAIGVLKTEFSLTSTSAGFLVSLVSLVGATLGAVTGAISDRFGLKSTLVFGFACLIIENITAAQTASVSILFFSRIIGAFGFAITVVTAPRLIALATTPTDRKVALSLWGVYMPMGISLGILLATILLPIWGWRTLWLFVGVLLFIFMTVLIIKVPKDTLPRDQQTATPALDNFKKVARTKGVWLLGACFGCYSIQWFALMTWLPTQLSALNTMGEVSAALATIVIILSNIIGILIATHWMKRGGSRAVALAIAFMGISATTYTMFALPPDPTWRIGLAILFSTFGGFIPPSILEGASALSPHPRLLGTMNGFVIQGSNLGALFGAPILGFFFDLTQSWNAMWQLSISFSILGMLLAFYIHKAEKQTG